MLQLKSCFLRSEKTTKHSANGKSHCLRSWRTGRCSSLCPLRSSRLELALQKLPSVLWPCDGAPARIFSFTRRLSFSLICLGGNCWNTAEMVVPQISQEPSSLSPSLRLMGISAPVETALVDFAGESNCFACHFVLHPPQERLVKAAWKHYSVSSSQSFLSLEKNSSYFVATRRKLLIFIHKNEIIFMKLCWIP